MGVRDQNYRVDLVGPTVDVIHSRLDALEARVKELEVDVQENRKRISNQGAHLYSITQQVRELEPSTEPEQGAEQAIDVGKVREAWKHLSALHDGIDCAVLATHWRILLRDSYHALRIALGIEWDHKTGQAIGEGAG